MMNHAAKPLHVMLAVRERIIGLVNEHMDLHPEDDAEEVLFALLEKNPEAKCLWKPKEKKS